MKTRTKPTHNHAILTMLQTDQLVSSSNVYKVTKKYCPTGCMRLAARISDLKKLGYKIKTLSVSTKHSTFAVYEII